MTSKLMRRPSLINGYDALFLVLEEPGRGHRFFVGVIRNTDEDYGNVKPWEDR